MKDLRAVRACLARGIKGAVIDGACRDREDIIDLGFPVFVRGVSPNGTVKEQLGAIDEPMSCGGVIVEAGDVIVGDGDGVVAVRSADAEEVLKKAAAKRDNEDEMRKLYEQGKTTVELMRKQIYFCLEKIRDNESENTPGKAGCTHGRMHRHLRP